MTNSQKPPASPPPSRARQQQRAEAARLRVIIVVAALAVVAVIVGIVVAVGGDDDTPDPSASGDTVEIAESVDVTGDALPDFEGSADDPAIGLTAPSVLSVDHDGAFVEFVPGRNPTLLVFAAHWCPHCRAEIPRIAEPLGERLAGDADVFLVSTAQDAQSPNWPPSEWLDEEGWLRPVLVDDAAGTIARRFGLTGFPFFVAIDADGNVVARASGEIGVDATLALVDLAAGE